MWKVVITLCCIMHTCRGKIGTSTHSSVGCFARFAEPPGLRLGSSKRQSAIMLAVKAP